jgi:ferredoxin-NADP reductase
VPTSSQVSGAARELRVVRATREAEDVLSFALADPTGADLPAWTPGAHIDVRLTAELSRQYSLCGDPADRRHWRIAVLLEQPGRGGSRYLHERVTTGSLLSVGAPRNNFPLIEADRYEFIAGGIGITPLLPMIAAVHANGADWQLHYGGRLRERMAFLPELAAYAARVRVHPEAELGLLPLAEILGAAADGAAVYCCGPEPLLKAVEQVHGGRAAGTLHVERFHAKEIETNPAADGGFEVVLNSTGAVVPVLAGQSILAALTRAGLDVPSSCLEGTCATCETTVLAGEVDHRDSVLTEDEQAAGRTMMLCVSRARSPRLVLDM